MYLTEAQEEYGRNQEEFAGAGSPWMGAAMEARTHCAYNQTRECFLGLEIAAADLPFPALAEKMKSLLLRSGEGLWITPFRGLPTTEIPAPLDMIYLDEEGRVLDVVESFPTFRVSTSCPRPASVVALPAHSIYSSQTQPGDQLVVCVAEEMEQRLSALASGRSGSGPVQSAVLLREEPLWSGGPGMLAFEQRNTEPKPALEQRHEMELAKPGRAMKAPRNWLERWWSPDPRKAPRQAAPGIAAYYWNGAAPAAHGIRDISSTGVYVVTEERWYPGTLVLMTLQRDGGEETSERSISVLTRAVRWGHDGVGLQFILPNAKEARMGRNPLLDGADRKQFERFLEQLKKDK